MAMLKTPYNFVPAAPFVLYPDWAAQASQDHPFADGLSGELSVEIINSTPLCVGGEQVKPDNAIGTVKCYRTPDDQLAIPGSSLNGMLRSALAPIVFARLSQVEDKKLSVRDINSSGTYYAKTIVQQPANAGWLRFNDGQWQIRASKYVRMHQQEIIDSFGLSVADWKKAKTVQQRYKLLKGLQTINFNTQEVTGVRKITQAKVHKQGNNSGILVVTGQPGAPFDAVTFNKKTKQSEKVQKKWEFVFYEAEGHWHVLPEQALKDFFFVHENSKEWEFLRKQKHGSAEIPVFYHGAIDSVKSLGLAQMYRLAQKNSLHDALRNITEQHLNTGKADFIDLLFGRLKPTEVGAEHNWGLRGRLNIGLFVAEGEPKVKKTKPTVLMEPKASYYPAYLQQDPDKAVVTLDSSHPKLNGWKRYPVKPEYIQQPPKDVSDEVKVVLETVEEGASFKGRIRFHNLRPVELGALLWILDFGSQKHLRHSLGMGKPYGLGQIQMLVDVESSRVIPNDREALVGVPEKNIYSAASQLFVQYMDDVWKSVIDNSERGVKRWIDSPQVANLLEMANPELGERNAQSLVYMTDLKDFRNTKSRNGRDQLSYLISDDVSWSASMSGVCEHAAEGDITGVLEKLEQQAKAEELRANSTEGQNLLLDVEAIFSAAGDELTKSQEGNATKILNSICVLETEELPSLMDADAALTKAESYGKKKLEKAAQKLRKFLTNS